MCASWWRTVILDEVLLTALAHELLVPVLVDVVVYIIFNCDLQTYAQHTVSASCSFPTHRCTAVSRHPPQTGRSA